MKKIIHLNKLVGTFAENKEIARKIRIEQIMPTLLKGGEVIFDFDNISGATQSFIHALISDPIREFKDVAYDNLYYENANDNVRQIVAIVYRYMQESLSSDGE